MPLFVRGFGGDLLARGATEAGSVRPRLIDLRMSHTAARWMPGEVSRAARPATIEVPAGRFEVDRFTLTAGARTWTYDVEASHPHRLVHWTGPSGEEGSLTGTIREPYWNLSANGHEAMRAKLGLGQPSWLADPPGGG